jgi:DNA-binding NarL/FixJ family response regulator
MHSIRLLLVDDHRALLDALAMRDAAEPDLTVEATATNAAQAIALLPGRDPDVAVIDVHLGPADGIALGREIVARRPRTKLVALTGVEADADLAESVRSGFSGWVVKGSGFAELAAAVRGVHRGETHIPPRLLTRLLAVLLDPDADIDPAVSALRNLTSREREVLRCLSEGLSREEMAARMHISSNTVRTHIQSVLAKLNVHSAVAAAALWRESAETSGARS